MLRELCSVEFEKVQPADHHAGQAPSTDTKKREPGNAEERAIKEKAMLPQGVDATFTERPKRLVNGENCERYNEDEHGPTGYDRDQHDRQDDEPELGDDV